MKNKGFTLIELLVVVLIIGILAGVALPQYTKAVEKSRATEAITLLSNIAKAETVYALGTNSFTNDLNALDIQMPNINARTTSQAETKNFNITVALDGSTLNLTASRKGTVNVYAIAGSMPLNGNLQMWCKVGAGYGNMPENDNVDVGSTEAGKICKSIANGKKSGVIMR